MNLYNYLDYRKFVNDWVKAKPKHGRGIYRNIAQSLKISTVVVSQVFSGKRELSMEQALELADFLNLDAQDRKYFLLLVQYSRAGTHKLKSHLKLEIEQLQIKSKELMQRIKVQVALPDEVASTYYSSWVYSASKLATSIPKIKNANQIADILNIDPIKISKVVDFLLKNNLIISKDGSLENGPQSTHLPAHSPFTPKYHVTWRLKGLGVIEDIRENELFFTSPVSLSKADIANIKEKLTVLVKDYIDTVKRSPEETLACLTIDWFEVR